MGGLVETKIGPEKLKELLLLCTKEGHFTFGGEAYQQIDGVMMGSPLGSLVADIFMCELGAALMPKMGDGVQHWSGCVDGTFAFVGPDSAGRIKNILGQYDERIQFTCDGEKERKIAFL